MCICREVLQSNLTNLLKSEGLGTLHQKLYQQFVKPLAVPPMHGAYNWGHHFELPQQGQGFVIFRADCSNDVHLAISPKPQSMDPMYELVIGGWSNTSSVVRRRSQGSNLCTVPVGLNKPRLDTVNDLWVSIDKTTKYVRMGQGREPTLESMFCIYKDLQFLSEARYICFSTWDVPATYSNIMVLTME